jgi:amino acid adenylation domain-containing protein
MSNVVTAGAEQLDLWLAASQEPESSRYNVPICLTFQGQVDEAAVRAALVRLYERHPALRSSFRTNDDGTVEQIVAGRVEPSLRIVRSGEDLDDARRTAWAEQVGLRPLDMTTPGLLRSDLLLEPGGAVLVMTGHHIVLDAASVDVLVDDLCSFYEQSVAPRPAGEETGAEESRQDAEEPSAEPTENLAYWMDLLHEPSEMLEPLPDLVRGVRPSSAGCEEASITGASVTALRAHFESALVSPAIGVLAAWTAILHQWSGQAEGLLGIPFSGRLGSGYDDTVGLFARVLPVRSSFAPQTSWTDHLTAVRGQVIESFEHSGVDTAALRAELASRGQRYPTFRATYTHRTMADVRRLRSGTTVTCVDVRLGAVKHDIALMAIEGAGGLTLKLDYDVGVYRRSTARAMLDQLRGLLLAAAASPSTHMGGLLLEADSMAKPAGGAAGPRAIHPTRTPPEMVVDAATSGPDRIAVIHGTESLTYGELVAASAQVARWLLQDDQHTARSGQEPEELVAVLLSEGIDAVVAFLGTALAGKAYLPLEPGYPDEKLQSILRDSGVHRVLTSPAGVERLARLGHTAHSVTDVRAAASGLPATPPAVGLHPDMLLNVLYTSGSTGRPKGVMLSHLGVSRLMQGDGYVRLEPDDRIAHLSPLNFDGATYEIWGALTHGARLVILDRELALSPAELRDSVAEHGVTMLMVTTPLFHNLVTEAPDLFQHLRVMVFGGDTAAIPQVARAVKWCGPGVLLHGYGPTENSFTSMFTKVDAVVNGSRTLSIGHCVPGTEAYVVHEGTFDLAPVGCPGELLLGGVGLARGYLGDPRRTAESFVPDPFSGLPGHRLYRTGDRVRRLPGGEIEFVGRMDEQVKIRSQRIELGEIRSALLADPAVRACHVTTWRNPRDEKEIAAYLVMQPAGTWQDVRSRIGSVLPDFAVPTAWAELDELPLNANGKVDWRRLPAPRRRSGERPAAGVRTMVEAPGLGAVRDAWCEVLGEAPHDDDANFFEAGGHSLLLVRLQAMLKRHAGLELTIAELLRYTSVRAQAARLSRPDEAAQSPLSAGPAAANEPIAIIGVAGRFALAPNIHAFWDNLRDARDCVAGAGTPAFPLGDGRLRIDRWGVLDAPRAFDAELFRLSPAEARATDPQHALLHECLWAAMENAAVTLDQLRGRTSIYAGCAESEAREPLGGDSLAEGLSQAFSSRPSFAATRYSYRHDFQGESVVVDTACSTSLVAVHLACASLRSGASDYAFAGGVSIEDPADGGYVYEPGMIYATDGVCRPFDERTTGTVGGDGAGVVLLKRLSDALRDGDPVHATIVGSAINNDGNRKAGYTAPGADGQVSVFRNALRFAGRDADHLGFVETHGTGTRLGDAVEATALGEVVGERAAALPLSSVKSAIGHCNTAAGIAGLLTAVYALGEKVLPGTVNSGQPIEELTQNRGLRLLIANEEWPTGNTPRLAGVSSFGIGGTNACVLVEEFTEPTGGTHQ